MNILIVNQDWYASQLEALGHRVISFGRSEYLDIRQEKVLISWSEIKTLLPEDFRPDLLIIHDNSSPILITELESIDIPSVFYSVDTHHHLAFHRYLGLVFSHLFVAQKDYIPAFSSFSIVPHWLPLWASVHMEPAHEKSFGAVFLGTLNPELNPERVKFFTELQKHIDIDVRTAAFPDIFPRSQIIVNQTVKGDLNFRVFEAMMSGALLLTERAANGLNELFEEGKHLVLYEKGNVQEAAAKISYYLKHTTEANKIGLEGRAEICDKHLAKHRAQSILNNLNSPTKPVNFQNAFAPIHNYSHLVCQLQVNGEKLWRSRASLEILRIAQIGLQLGHKLDQTLAIDIMKALLSIEDILSPTMVQNLLDDLRQSYPDLSVLHLVKIDQLASNGKKELAEALAQNLYTQSGNEIVIHAGRVVKELRDL